MKSLNFAKKYNLIELNLNSFTLPIVKKVQHASADLRRIFNQDNQGIIEYNKGRRVIENVVFTNISSNTVWNKLFSAIREIEHVEFNYCYFTRCNLSDLNISGCKFTNCTFESSTLNGSNFTHCEMRAVSFSDTTILGTAFDTVEFIHTRFQNCDIKCSAFTRISCAVAESCVFERCNLYENSYIDAQFYNAEIDLSKEFVFADKGVIVYKTFNSVYTAPESWKIEKGSPIRETVNGNSTVHCGSGVNVATINWILGQRFEPDAVVWKCYIPYGYLPYVTVPLPFKGKFRASCVVLDEPIGTIDELNLKYGVQK